MSIATLVESKADPRIRALERSSPGLKWANVGPALEAHALASPDFDLDRGAAAPGNREVHLMVTGFDGEELCLAAADLADLHTIDEHVVRPQSVDPSVTPPNELQLGRLAWRLL